MPGYAQPPEMIIIVGAPRSGTNMLRDILTSFRGVGTWPCDEINAIWRHGHLDYPFDDLHRSRVTQRSRRYVRRAFSRLAHRGDYRQVVEKTCATSLRVGYVADLLPEARFVFIYRDGYDAVASAVKRWQAEVDLAYTLRKMRYTPPTDLPHYVGRFLTNRLSQRRDSQRRLPTWGPLTAEVADLGHQGDVYGAASAQWAQCVSASVASFEQLDATRVSRVCYEELVSQPAETTEALVKSLGLRTDGTDVDAAAAHIRSDRTGRGASELAAQGELRRVSQWIEPIRGLLGYEPVLQR